MMTPLVDNCDLNKSDRDEEDGDEAHQPYAIEPVPPPVALVPQCLSQPVDWCAGFEQYRQSMQHSDTSNCTAPSAPMEEEDDRKPAAEPDATINLCKVDRMTIALKKKKEHFKGMRGGMLDAEYTTNKHAVRKKSKVNTWMDILPKEDIPLYELAFMVKNSYYVGGHAEEPEYVLKFISVLRGLHTPDKRYLINLSMCAL
jgi:hypothetical protein